MPEISIIIRTFNEEKHLPVLLEALSKQTFRNFEIILVDSGSTDKTLLIAQDKCKKIIRIHSRDFTFGYSLNVGCRNSLGKYFVIISAHAFPSNNKWLENLTAPFIDESVAMTYGRHIGAEQNKFSEKRDFKKYFCSSEKNSHPFSFFANNANSAIKRSVWEKHPFDECLTGLEDIAWAKKTQDLNLITKYVPEAVVYHIHEESWDKIYNRYRREAIAARHIGLPHPPLASPSFKRFITYICGDIFDDLNNFNRNRLKEIFLFRFYQWIGTRHGWFHNKNNRSFTLKDRDSLYFSGANNGVVVLDKNCAQWKEIAMPEVKPGDVLVKVAYVGVCQTDLEIYKGELGYYKHGIAKYPIIPGHEFSGEVVKVGANNQKTFKIGDKVVGECVISCGNCSFCRKGNRIACVERKEIGVMNHDGAYSKFIVLPAHFLHHIPEELDLKVACLAEPLAVVLRAVRRVEHRIKFASRCAVVGAGPIGNFCAQILSALGHTVKVYDRNESRLKFFKKNIITSSATLEDCADYDLIIEASGNLDALSCVLTKSRAGSIILLLGFPYGKLKYNFEDVVGKEKTIIGSVGGSNEDFVKALQILSTLDTVNFLKAVVPIKEFLYAWKLHSSKEYLKVILSVG
ncbi:MAG: alcohol dehydrogenase catalytic domain-containing protein [Patescibacteria group bacterium]